MRFIGRLATAVAVVHTSAYAATEPSPSIGPVPSWVVPAEVPAADAGQASAPFQFLLMSSQERVLPDGIENYIQYTAVAQSTAGLQALGNVTLPWNVERSELTLHKVAIRRGDRSIDLLKEGELLVLRRENNLERAVLDGIRTVVIPAKGLETGDLLTVAATYKTKKSAVGNKADNIHQLSFAVPILSAERRFLVADGVAPTWKVDVESMKPVVTRKEGLTEFVFRQANIEPIKAPKHAPERLKLPILQMTTYASWGEVAAELKPGFDKARIPAAGSPLLIEADRIAAAHRAPGDRMMAALRLAQERVRYVALLLGDGAHIPASADETWERKFGDCKGKTALLLALLDRLGISAEAVLVSNAYNDRLAGQLPSLTLFDHVLVRAEIDGETYFLDPTDYGQRSLSDVRSTGFVSGLPLIDKASMVYFKPATLAAPTRDATLNWDASKGVDGAIPYEAKLVLRGAAAASARAKLDAATDVEEFDKSLKDMMPGVPNAKLKIVEKTPDAPDGTFVVRFAGEAEMDWSPFEGERETRYQFSNATTRWEAEFDRAEGAGKEWPVVLSATPYWERLTETIVLPDGGKGYAIEGDALSRTLGGSSVSRTLSRDGARATMVSEFRHHQREITADEARLAEEELETLNQDFAYIVGPRVKKRR